MRHLIVILCLLSGGCASAARRESDAEARGYERGYRQAVQEQYWILQRQQRAGAPATPGNP